MLFGLNKEILDSLSKEIVVMQPGLSIVVLKSQATWQIPSKVLFYNKLKMALP
jgi:hypothetical protein